MYRLRYKPLQAVVPTPSDRHDRADTRIRLIHPRRAQPEDRIPRQPQPPEPGVLQPHPIHSFYDSTMECPTGWTRRLSLPGSVTFQRNINMNSLYAQDTYTRARLTLQGGVRFDAIGTSYPDTGAGGPDYLLMPTRIFYPAGPPMGNHWKDFTPRIGAAYDLFGTARRRSR